MSEIDIQEALERLKLEFIDTSAEKLDKIDAIIDRLYRGEEDNRGHDFVEFQRDIHSLKGSAGTYGLQSVSLIAHRLEDYMETSRRLSSENLMDVQFFIDRIREILEGGEDVINERLTAILESLPSSAIGSENKDEPAGKVVLLVMSKGVQRKLVTSDLSACGFELAYADHPLDAFRLAVSLKPDLIITSLEFDNLSGMELARALRGVGSMSETPIVLLTSHSIENIADDLPNATRAVRKDAGFADRLKEALSQFGFSVADRTQASA